MSHANPAKKIINDPLKCADELFEGLVLAYDGKARRVGTRSIIMNDLRPNAPALLVGRASSSLPATPGTQTAGDALLRRRPPGDAEPTVRRDDAAGCGDAVLAARGTVGGPGLTPFGDDAAGAAGGGGGTGTGP